MERLYAIGYNLGGCLTMVGFAVCRFAGELVNLIGLGFDSAGSGLDRLSGKLRATAEDMFRWSPGEIQNDGDVDFDFED